MRDRRLRERLLDGGVIAGPLFIVTFTILGSRRTGYDALRHPVGWLTAAFARARPIRTL
jgi:hypothetical protein